jgi:Uma2 family endonuclease
MMKGMQTGTLVSVDEYLHTSYSPDCEYVEGRILERNVGEQDHGNLQMSLSAYLFNRRHEWGIRVNPEQRVQVRTDRFRVPDICVVAGKRPAEQIFINPPFLCIEILSPEDRMSEILERVRDYVTFGVRYAWVLDPRTRSAHIYDSDGVHDMKDGMLWTSDPDILVPLDQLFD